MSTSSAESPTTAPIKPSRWKRRIAWTAGILLVLFGVAAYLLADTVRTLQSLRRVPGTNAYVMDYYGDYHIDEIRERGIDVNNVQDSLIETLFPDFVVPIVASFKRRYLPNDVTVEPNEHHCSTVALRSENGDVYFGRNFDWHHDAYLILRVHDRHGVASFSVLDLAYLNLDRSDLEQTSLIQRVPLLFAPYYLMDGMNRHGVAVSDMSAPAEPPHEPGKPALLLSTLMRLILDRAKTADEAVAMVNEYNIHFVDTREHLMIADASGQFRVIEFVDGKTVVTSPQQPWQVCTNHLVWQRTEEQNDARCSRYRIGSDLAASEQGTVTFDNALKITQSMSVEDFTMWSSVYNLTKGDACIRYKGREQDEYRDQLTMAQNRRAGGGHSPR